MPIYVGVNGEAKLVTQAYIGNKNNYAIPLYLQDIIPKGYAPIDHIYTTENASNGRINTGIPITVYTKVVLIFATYNNEENSGYILRSTTNNTNYTLGVLGYSNPYLYCRWGSVQITTANNSKQVNIPHNNNDNLTNIPNAYYTYIMCNSGNKDCYVKKDDQKFSLGNNTDSSITNAGPIRLIFTKNIPFCYCAIYQNVLKDFSPTMEFYPCINIDSGKPGLYETINGVFYTNDYFASGPVISKYNFPSFEED